MWVINNDKDRIKIYLKTDIESNITNLTNESNQIHNLISVISISAGGSSSGADRQMADDCQRALQAIAEALQSLTTCRVYANQIETREWIDDE